MINLGVMNGKQKLHRRFITETEKECFFKEDRNIPVGCHLVSMTAKRGIIEDSTQPIVIKDTSMLKRIVPILKSELKRIEEELGSHN